MYVCTYVCTYIHTYASLFCDFYFRARVSKFHIVRRYTYVHYTTYYIGSDIDAMITCPE